MAFTRHNIHQRLPLYRADSYDWDKPKYTHVISTDQSRWRLSVRSVPKPVGLALLLFIGTVSYLMSLQGDNLLYINEHLGIMGAELVVSVACMTTITVMLYASRMRRSMRRVTFLAMLGTMVVLYCYDHGERFEKHGFYNLLVFLAIYVPLNIAIAVFYILWCKIENFLVYFAVASIIAGISAGISLVHYRRVFDQGVLGRFQYIPGECQWVGTNIPYIDLLPAGAQNFWAGSSKCAKEKLQIRAHIDETGTLHVDCGHEDKIYVDVLPDTRLWPMKDKDLWNGYNRNVLNATRRMPYTSAPFMVPHGIQSVVVRCGSSSSVVTRVSPPARSLPQYVPPADSDTRRDRSTNDDDWFDVSQIAHTRRQRPNVIFLMLDAVSHRMFFRRLPRTARVLRTLDRPGTSRLFELYRYHSPMFAGEIYPSKEKQLPIWAYYRDRGYVTARVETGCEDWPQEYLADKFDPQTFAFSDRSLDYELTSPFCLPEVYPETGNAFGNFKGTHSITARCLYGRYLHEYALDYIRKLKRDIRASRRDGKPYMITAAFMEGHEGTSEVLATMDHALSEFIEGMRNSGELEDTVFILGADHGLHMGLNFVFTQNGRIEHQNPLFAMSMPEYLYQFANAYQEHTGDGLSPFKANEQRLMTPFETHYTFRALADWPKFNIDDWKRSLFSAQKAGRTCEEAGIGASYCMCKVPESRN
ncbi:hypothetical protein DL89DRAFT_268968 [Linderina pennispora]|uniref:DUF229-domain-containing protein n=1 Tax=Linderina pennispora TaxID=61395 RepID=A0A1Y1W2S9_9FUNG|nr:uncharacterized protein DL89DRAFT_268968 [Linderina pennispora]ORX67757.1 hypothetical protein DL89DRAFT_268968 [Linderina pennispora]